MTGTDETWFGLDASLLKGRRCLPGGQSLARLLAEHRSVRNVQDLAPLTIKQILEWADAHKTTTGDWPNKNTGQIPDTDESWARVTNALHQGQRGLKSGTSLAKLLAQHRNVRNILDLSPLTIRQILAWADAHKAATTNWPNQYSGQVTGTDETWAGINAALSRGNRALPGGSTLAKLLKERGARDTNESVQSAIQ